jgi:L-ribulose-5-phosphate 3-epimerase
MFNISLAQWSLHRTLLGVGSGTVDWTRLEHDLRTDPNNAIRGEMDHLDFITAAKRDYGIDAVEYVNTFFFGRAQDQAYLNEMKNRADSEGVKSLLIMCDFEGRPGDPNRAAAQQAVENHYKWIEAAQYLGCHAIRVNVGSGLADPDGQAAWATEDLRRLAEFSDPFGIHILVENHGELSSNATWLTGVIRQADHARLGTLPDFGNFWITETECYDYYQGVEELMPYAKGVSAKSYDFDEDGDETTLDYERLIRIVTSAGYNGYIDVEYEGERLSEPAGIRATKALLERLRAGV